MKAVKCLSCGFAMKKNGKTSAGTQRWRCYLCGASTTLHYDDTTARFKEFLAWLLSKDTQAEMAGSGRTFRLIGQNVCPIWGASHQVDNLFRSR